MKKIWIDLDNSPHVLFFNPIIKELRNRGIQVVITSRNYAQVTKLADLFGIDHKKIGHHYGKHKLLKLIGLLIRSLQMIPFYLKEKPEIVLSHGSRSMHLVAKLFNVPIVYSTDYEHATYLPFATPRVMIIPEVLPYEAVKDFANEIRRYPGIKEDVYVPDFVPDKHALDFLNLKEDDIIISIRPPATAAHYHTHKSDELFNAVVEYHVTVPNIKIIIVSRTQKQKKEITEKWKKHIIAGKLILPEKVINGLDLIWHSDLVISGGGTMIREAAALSVPAYSIFGGKKGAVDRYLEESGRLKLISEVDEIKTEIILTKRDKSVTLAQDSKETLNTIVDEVIKIINETRDKYFRNKNLKLME